jgi:hypothetical protein
VSQIVPLVGHRSHAYQQYLLDILCMQAMCTTNWPIINYALVKIIGMYTRDMLEIGNVHTGYVLHGGLVLNVMASTKVK